MDELRIRARNGTLAHNLDPVTSIPIGGGVMEPKYDGWRLLAEVADGEVRFYSRKGNTYDVPRAAQELLRYFPAGTWLDGEAVAIRFDADGKVINEWHLAQSALTTKSGPNAAADKITFMVFDLLAHRGIDARPVPFWKRRELLETAFRDKDFNAVQLTHQLPASRENHEALVALGFEGSVIKRLNAPYASGKKGYGQWKWKHEATEDVVVIGFEPGKDVGAVIFGQFRDGELVRRGKCKRKPNIIPTPDLMSWAGKVIEVKHNGVMPGGALRHPSMNRLREDKSSEECVWGCMTPRT